MTRCTSVLLLLALPAFAAAQSDGGAEAREPARLHWLDAAPVTRTGPTPELLELGQRLFETRCSICHGRYGQGNGLAAPYLATSPRDFTRGVFKLRTVSYGRFPADDDLFRTITVGFPAYGMPAVDYLSERERWALVHHVKRLVRDGFRAEMEWEGLGDLSYDPDGELSEDERAELDEELAELRADIDDTLEIWFETERALPLGSAVAATDAALARGKELFEGALDCASCHGPDGSGDGPSVSDHMKDDWDNTIRPRNFSAGPWYFKAGNRPRDIVRTLRCGIPGTPMPAYAENDEDVPDLWALAHHVRRLAGEPRWVQDAAPAPAKTTGPVSLRGRATFEGERPETLRLPINKDHDVCGHGQRSREPVRTDATGGLRDVVVYVDTKGKPLGEWSHPKDGYVLDQKGCWFEPFITIFPRDPEVRLEIVNSDPVLHNVHAYETIGRARRSLFNLSQPSGTEPILQELRIGRRTREVQLKCDAHDFMNGYLFVADNPFYARARDDGTYGIEGVPAGEHTVSAWHPTLGELSRKQVLVEAGKPTTVDFTFRPKAAGERR